MTNMIEANIRLEVLTEDHRQDLYAAAQDESIWRYTLTSALGDAFQIWFDKALAELSAGDSLPYVVRRNKDQKILGSTRFYQIDRAHKNLSIGYTWYIPEVWATVVNPACKYLLLHQAFEQMGMHRVEFLTDKRNERSRAAIRKLGATEEGILRAHRISHNATLRDTVIFSIIQPEWPFVKANLEARIKQLGTRS